MFFFLFLLVVYVTFIRFRIVTHIFSYVGSNVGLKSIQKVGTLQENTIKMMILWLVLLILGNDVVPCEILDDIHCWQFICIPVDEVIEKEKYIFFILIQNSYWIIEKTQKKIKEFFIVDFQLFLLHSSLTLLFYP